MSFTDTEGIFNLICDSNDRGTIRLSNGNSDAVCGTPGFMDEIVVENISLEGEKLIINGEEVDGDLLTSHKGTVIRVWFDDKDEAHYSTFKKIDGYKFIPKGMNVMERFWSLNPYKKEEFEKILINQKDFCHCFMLVIPETLYGSRLCIGSGFIFYIGSFDKNSKRVESIPEIDITYKTYDGDNNLIFHSSDKLIRGNIKLTPQEGFELLTLGYQDKLSLPISDNYQSNFPLSIRGESIIVKKDDKLVRYASKAYKLRESFFNDKLKHTIYYGFCNLKPGGEGKYFEFPNVGSFDDLQTNPMEFDSFDYCDENLSFNGDDNWDVSERRMLYLRNFFLGLCPVFYLHQVNIIFHEMFNFGGILHEFIRRNDALKPKTSKRTEDRISKYREIFKDKKQFNYWVNNEHLWSMYNILASIISSSN